MSNTKSVALMTGAMAAFALGDALVKVATNYVSPAQGIFLMSAFITVIFSALCWLNRQPFLSPALLTWPIVLRNVVEALTAICMFNALKAAPLSLVISITQAVPLLVTLGAVIFLKEIVGLRRWTAIVVGLCGVLIMLQPWTGDLSIGATWAVLAAIGLAVRDLAARWVPSSVSTLQLALWGMASLMPAALILFPFSDSHGIITLPIVGLLVLTAIATAAGYYAVTAAMRIGDVSIVAPFRYTRLVFALVLAILFLSERLDWTTVSGAVIVIASGLFVLLRERRLAR